MKRFPGLLRGVVLCTVLVPAASMAAGQASINQREHDQQARVNQGIKSGELTRKETARLENKEARIRVNQRFDKKKDGGKLTAADRTHLQKQLNAASHDIYRDKHNNKVQH